MPLGVKGNICLLDCKLLLTIGQHGNVGIHLLQLGISILLMFFFIKLLFLLSPFADFMDRRKLRKKGMTEVIANDMKKALGWWAIGLFLMLLGV